MSKISPNLWLEDSRDFVIKYPYSGLKGFHSWVLFSARNLMEVSYGELDWLLPFNSAPRFLQPIKDFVIEHYKLKKEPIKLIFYLPLFEYSITHDARRMGVLKEFILEFIDQLPLHNSWGEHKPDAIVNLLHKQELGKLGFQKQQDSKGIYLLSEEYFQYGLLLSFRWKTNFDAKGYTNYLLKSPDFDPTQSKLFQNTKTSYVNGLVHQAEQGDRYSRQVLVEGTEGDLDLSDPNVWYDCGLLFSKYLSENLSDPHNKKILQISLDPDNLVLDNTLANKSFYFTLTLSEKKTGTFINFKP